MIAFRASLIAASVAAVFIGGYSAIADERAGRQIVQTIPDESGAGPVRLGPRRAISPVPAEGVLETVPARATPEEGLSTTVSPSGEAGPVDVQMLQAVDADSVGVIDDKDGGLGVDMWGAADRNYIGRVIALLPRNVWSPTMRDLLRRLLLTRAMAPPRETPGPGLLPLRIDALFALGDLESALSLISRAPIAPLDEQLLRTEVESRFFRQDTTGACGQVRAAAQDYKDAYWQQAMAYCLALAGKTAEAALLSDILAERSNAVHPAFFAAMDRLSGGPPPEIASLLEPSALYLSMMRTASLTLPRDVSSGASASVQNAVALSPNATLDLRLEAAEKAAERGILSGKTLVDIYGAVPFEDSVLKDPLARAAAEWGPKGRALLMRVADNQSVPAARAEVLQSALKLARENGGYRVIAVASRPWLVAFPPVSELAWFAGTAARALISAGEFDAARGWVRLGLKHANDTAGEGVAPGALWPLAMVLGVEASESASPAALVAWWQSRNQAGTESAIEAARAYYALLDMLDVAIPSELWTPILGAAPPKEARIPGPGIESALRRAAMAGHKGEVVGLALVALGETGPAANNLHAVGMAVRALRQVGLTIEAQRLVAEAAIAAGL
ncbi:MAG: hypothetical protein HOM58_15755 [Rhodospirillaceae bacterium]|jgi:hypothetical protein|nr:hypothetical protein [Rhodospirillaceae bacterium]MBT5455200.1 hypothetical protein [Rhodospirillaceae bacterium]